MFLMVIVVILSTSVKIRGKLEINWQVIIWQIQFSQVRLVKIFKTISFLQN